MRLRLTKLDEFQLLTCVKHGVWGSKPARFRHWQLGDLIAFIVEKTIAGLAEVTGEAFICRQRVFDDDVYPHRIPIRFSHFMRPEHRLPILGDVREALISQWGSKWGLGVRDQRPLSGENTETIAGAIRSQPNDLQGVEASIEQYLAEAKLQRDSAAAAPPRKPGKPGRKRQDALVEPEREPEEVLPSEDEESAHSRAQSALKELGRVTDSSVWIASNDRNRTYRGSTLGDGCLEALPSLGLSDEASRRISLIDVIWVRQNSPVCACEVETSTSIYSGLLRMSDLLCVVPALNIKLYIVAPSARQEKVMAELGRPTFRRIGLSDYCQFIPAEKLLRLLEKVEGLTGYVQPTILDTIAVSLDGEAGSSLAWTEHPLSDASARNGNAHAPIQ